MSIEEQHVALPKLYGAPAYGRPPRSYDAQPRPIDPDDLPIEAHRTDEDPLLPAGSDDADATGPGSAGGSGTQARLQGRPFTLRSLGRIFTGRS